ncbi:hypothetical protein B7494_g6031 [Chlorociboria aeruginascens]|nr:hypothetical protein B7494_g6031 [Chlorociboria aeruginascens]
MGSSSPLVPTFQGHIASTQDALILFEACLTGGVSHVPRRPHDRERASLIKSGNVFIYEDHSSGIKRWTDGVPWSPSRILGNFLVYRELERPFPPGEKKRAMKRNKRSPGISKAQEPFGRLNAAISTGYSPASITSPGFQSTNAISLSKETERSLIGSLVDSYGFKSEGLVKKTVSVTIAGVSHHLVSYYTVADVMSNKFNNPSRDQRFRHITPRPDLITKQNFRTPIDEVDTLDRLHDRIAYGSYPYARNDYELTNQSMSHHPMSLPTPPVLSYASSSNIYPRYGMHAPSGQYGDPFPSTNVSNDGYGHHFTSSSSSATYPSLKIEHYDPGDYQQQRYNSALGVGNDNRALISSNGRSSPRRSSNYELSGSIDSNISGFSSASLESKLTSDSGYVSSGFYTNPRETTNAQQNFVSQRALPSPNLQAVYGRPAAHSYAPIASGGAKENIWPVGNASAGHGHYMASQQQQWTSTGTS